MKWQLGQFLLHAVLGLLVVGAVRAVQTLSGPGDQQCLVLLLFPISGWLIGWWLPYGAPGASLAVVAWFVSQFPSQAGPTAKSIVTGFTVGLGGGMLVCEILAAMTRIVRSNQSNSQAHDGT